MSIMHAVRIFTSVMHIRHSLIVVLWERLYKIAHCPYLILVLTK